MNRRASDKTNFQKETLIKQIKQFSYEQLSDFSVPQLQDIILGLFGRRSAEYSNCSGSQNQHGMAHMICDACDIEYPGKYNLDRTISMLLYKLKGG